MEIMISDFPTIWCLIALAWFVINFLDSYHTNHTILLMFHGSINIGLFHVKTKQPWTKILRINPAVQQFVKSVSFPLIQSHRFQLFRELDRRQNKFPNKPIIGINYETYWERKNSPSLGLLCTWFGKEKIIIMETF